jgi:hypothetical protein
VIATYGAQVVDTFYVKDMFGLKLHQKPAGGAGEASCARPSPKGAERARHETDRRLVSGFLTVGTWTLLSRLSDRRIWLCRAMR